MIYILAAILIFGVLIALHELGHFCAAKACGVRVNEFAIGMGPAILKKTKGETTYALRLLPLPALDGGKIFFLVVNAVCMLTIRKKIPEKFENYVHLAGFALLMLLMVVITFQDVWKLFK